MSNVSTSEKDILEFLENEIERLMPPDLTIHRQIEVYNPIHDCVSKIDEGIVGLIQLMWDMGIETQLSCQENKPGIMWIYLPCSEAERFLTIISSKRDEELVDPPTSMYGRMMNFDWGDDWEYDVCIDDFAEKLNEEADEVFLEGDSYIMVSISIRFPISDYEKIISRLKDFNSCRDKS